MGIGDIFRSEVKTEERRAGALSLRPTTPTGPAGPHLVPPPNNPFRCIPPRAFCVRLSRHRLALRRLVGRRRPKPGAEVFVGHFAGDKHPPGTPTRSLPCPLCCAKLCTETLT